MAAQVLVLYNEPLDPKAFEAYYFGTHVPLAKQLPGLRKYTVNRGGLSVPGGVPPYFFIAILDFDSMQAVQNAFASPQGVATVADVPRFASGGVTILTYETQEV